MLADDVSRSLVRALAAHSYNEMSSFDDVRKAGILVLRDNRYMGDEFMDAAMRVCALEWGWLAFPGSRAPFFGG